MNQKEVIEKFCTDKEYFSIVYDNKNKTFGKLINEQELKSLNFQENEIYTSTDFINKNVLFCMSVNLPVSGTIETPVRTLIKNLSNARIIEEIYPYTFNWRYNGETIEAYAVINSSNHVIQGTLARYGGTTTFLKVIKFRLKNIIRMNNNLTSNFNFNRNSDEIDKEILSTGSINFKTSSYCIPINLKWSWIDILKFSQKKLFTDFEYRDLDINYWRREINPDLMSDTQRIKITDPVKMDTTFLKYPPCIREITKMPIKGDEGRYILTRYFLSIHKPLDAKFLLRTIITDESEKEHVNGGNSKGQFRTILNNLDRYKEINCTRLCPWCDKNCKFNNPYEGLISEVNKNE